MANNEKRSVTDMLTEQFTGPAASAKRSRFDQKPKESVIAAAAAGNCKASSSDYFNRRIAEIQAKYKFKLDVPGQSLELPGAVCSPQSFESRDSSSSAEDVAKSYGDEFQRKDDAVAELKPPPGDLLKAVKVKLEPEEDKPDIRECFSVSTLPPPSFISQLLSPPAAAVSNTTAAVAPDENRYRVVCVQNLPPDCTDVDIIKEFQRNHDFGNVSYVAVAEQGNKAFLEFENVAATDRCLNFAKDKKNIVAINGTAVKIMFTNKPGLPRKGNESADATNVLFLQSCNPLHGKLIEVGDIYGICEEQGLSSSVVRMAIEHYATKVDAFIEFKSVAEATRAKFALNGRDIFHRCTMRAEFAYMEEVEVSQNDANHWDFLKSPLLHSCYQKPKEDGMLISLDKPNTFCGSLNMDLEDSAASVTNSWIPIGVGTKPWTVDNTQHLTTCSSGSSGISETFSLESAMFPYQNAATFDNFASPLLPTPEDYFGSSSCASPASQYSSRHGGYGTSGYRRMQARNRNGNSDYNEMPLDEPPAPPGFGLGESHAVLLVDHIDARKMNCDRLFNLFSLYGNVCKIIFLKARHADDRSVSAMIQMGDRTAAQRALEYLHGVPVFDYCLVIRLTDQPFVRSPSGSILLADGTPTFKNYTSCSFNRFCGPYATKNRIGKPSATLFFFYGSSYLSEDSLRLTFREYGVATLVEIKIFENRGPGHIRLTSTTGRLKFCTVSDAINALIVGNGSPLKGCNSSSLLKLSFCGGFPFDEAGNMIAQLPSTSPNKISKPPQLLFPSPSQSVAIAMPKLCDEDGNLKVQPEISPAFSSDGECSPTPSASSNGSGGGGSNEQAIDNVESNLEGKSTIKESGGGYCAKLDRVAFK